MPYLMKGKHVAGVMRPHIFKFSGRWLCLVRGTEFPQWHKAGVGSSPSVAYYQWMKKGHYAVSDEG